MKAAIPEISFILKMDRQLSNGKYPVALRVCYKRRRRYLRLEKLTAYPDQWIDGDPNNHQPARFIGKAFHYENERLRVWESKARDVINKMHVLHQPFTLDSFFNHLRLQDTRYTFFSFFKEVIEKLKDNEQIGSQKSYTDVLHRIKEFRKGKDMFFEDVTIQFLEDFSAYYKRNNRRDTTIGIYLRVIRAVFNRAIKAEIVEESRYPFKRYRLKTIKTKKKRSIPKDLLKQIFNYPAIPYSEQWNTINLLKFSYLCRGMNLPDMLRLRWNKHIKDGRIIYQRSKTGDPLDIKIEPEIQEIMNLYHFPGNVFVFPGLVEGLTENMIHERVKNVRSKVNKSLKQIARELSLPMAEDITFYWGRHTYANVLRKAGVDIRFIKDALGHESQKTTEIYLDSVENEQLDLTYEYLI